jgi:hypothetical protein
MTAVNPLENLFDALNAEQKLSLYKRLRQWYLEEYPAEKSKPTTPNASTKKVNEYLEYFAMGVINSMRSR